MWELETNYLLLLIAGESCALAAALFVLLRSGPVDLFRVLVSAFVAAALQAPIFLASVALGGNPAFTFVMLAWCGLALLGPVCAAAVLLSPRPRTRYSTAVCALALAGVPLSTWASFIEPKRLVLETPELDVPELDAPVRIAILADVQADRVTEHERSAFERLRELEPHLVLVPGDVFQGSRRLWDLSRPELVTLFGSFDVPTLLVSGNADYRQGLDGLCRESGMELCVNRILEFEIEGGRVVVLGLEDAGFPSRVVYAFEERAAADPSAFHIVLCHRAGAALDAMREDSPIDLVVGGHTHGGQVALPFFGPPITLSTLPRKIAAGGLHQHHGNWVYVSRGVGMERAEAPRIRFGVPPEITLLTVR